MVELKVKKLTSFKDKTIGLLGAQKAYPVLLKTRFGIHTFFLAFSVDILVLDSKDKVRHIVYGLKPYRFFFWNPMYDTVLELPNGEIKKHRVKIGDRIDLL